MITFPICSRILSWSCPPMSNFTFGNISANFISSTLLRCVIPTTKSQLGFNSAEAFLAASKKSSYNTKSFLLEGNKTPNIPTFTSSPLAFLNVKIVVFKKGTFTPSTTFPNGTYSSFIFSKALVFSQLNFDSLMRSCKSFWSKSNS